MSGGKNLLSLISGVSHASVNFFIGFSAVHQVSDVDPFKLFKDLKFVFSSHSDMICRLGAGFFLDGKNVNYG